MDDDEEDRCGLQMLSGEALTATALEVLTMMRRCRVGGVPLPRRLLPPPGRRPSATLTTAMEDIRDALRAADTAVALFMLGDVDGALVSQERERAAWRAVASRLRASLDVDRRLDPAACAPS